MKQLYTRWGKTLDPEHVLEEYPRPLCQRDSYCNLNGRWNYHFSDTDAFPDAWDGQILVPFSPETLLSGVGRQLKPGEYLWYERELPAFFSGRGRLLLHFGAVDQRCRVFINRKPVGEHAGGYLPFTIDITDAVTAAKEAASPAMLQVLVQDDSDTSYHSRGKQKLQRGGMYYTATSGIWQTVWMEEVPKDYIKELVVSPDPDRGQVRLRAVTDRALSFRVRVFAADDAWDDTKDLPADALLEQWGNTNEDLTISIDPVCLWTCEQPFLYPFTVTLEEAPDPSAETSSEASAAPGQSPDAGTLCPDTVKSYFALRAFTVEPDEKGLPRICLNHRPQFQRGVLDQGYWSDGLYTAPADDALIFDIASLKKLGYNMIRKHIKIEPQRWYYHCDRLGMVVWQDMVNGGTSYADWYVTYLGTLFSFLRIRPGDRNEKLLARQDAAGKEEFAREMTETIRLLKCHPSIAVWVIFNEGWGQFETKRMTELARQEDDTRLIDAASGWFDQGCGDLQSIHNYFFPLTIHPEKKRATVLSEFGGYTMDVPGHTACEDSYGYGACQDKAALREAFDKREKDVRALIPKGLCASVYTQVSDIEDEINGIFTYDREVQKFDVTPDA